MIQPASPDFVREYFPGIASLFFLRLDLPDPVAGGNKSFKQKYHIEEFRRKGADSILSFGGAFSNHIAALAIAGKRSGIPTIGVIRGEELNECSNAVMKFAAGCGMKLHFVTRSYYREKSQEETASELTKQFGNIYIVPEGGGGLPGVKGCREILYSECDRFDEIILPVGTGTTCAGIIQTAKSHQHVTGVAVVSARNHLEQEIRNMIGTDVSCTWTLNHDFTLGGYANTSSELNAFIDEVKQKYEIPLDHVYSGKALYALHRLAFSGEYEGRNVLFIHTGGYAFAQ